MTRTARTQRIWPNQSYLAQPKPTGSNLAVLGLNLGRTGANLGPTWAKLAPNSGLLAPTWAQLPPNWDLATNPHQSQKPLGRGCAVLDPTGAQVANRSCWAEVPKRSRWSPNWSHVMHMKVQVRPNMLGMLWRQLRASWAQRRRNDFVFGWPCAPFWSHVDPNLGRIAPKWSNLGPSCGMLAEVGAKWVEIGLQLGPSWPKLTPSAAGSKRRIRTMLCRYANRLLAPCPGRTWAPPSWSCTRLIGPFVLNYHLRCGWIFSIFFWWEDVLLVASRLGAGNRKLNSWITLDGGLTVPNKTATQSCQHRGMNLKTPWLDHQISGCFCYQEQI